MFTLTACGDADDADDKFADQHAESTPDENCAATHTFNDVEGNGSGAHIDEGSDETNEEGILDCFQLLEEGSTEVEDKVDTGPLLHHLQGGAENGSAKVGRRIPESAFEAVQPGSKVAMLRDNCTFVLVIGDDLCEFLLNKFGAFWFTSETGQDVCGLLEIALLDEITRGLGKEEKSGCENDSPEHLNSNRDTVGASIFSILGAIIDARSQQDTDCDAELVA